MAPIVKVAVIQLYPKVFLPNDHIYVTQLTNVCSHCNQSTTSTKQPTSYDRQQLKALNSPSCQSTI